VVISIHVPT